MRSVRLAALLLLAAAGAAPAQASAAAAPDTFRAEDLSVLVPAGLPHPVQEFANANSLRFSARNPAQTRGMQVIVERRGIRVASTTGRMAALDTFVQINIARTQADSVPFTYVRETVPADSGSLLATGVRATIMAPGRTLKSWARYYVTRSGPFRWASVVVVDASGADPYDDPDVQRTMRSVAFALPARPAARPFLLPDVGVAFTLPEGFPDLQRVPPAEAAAPVEYEAVSPDDNLTVTVSELTDPGSTADMPVALRARVLENMLNAATGVERVNQVVTAIPGWIVRSQAFVRIVAGFHEMAAVQRVFAPRSGPMRIVVVNLHRDGHPSIADDPRVTSLLASFHFVPRG